MIELESGTAVKELRAAFAFPQVVAIDKRDALVAPGANGQWTILTPVLKEPTAIRMTSLSGLAKYIEANVDKHAEGETMLHVVTEAQVVLLGGLENEDAQFRRRQFAVASASPLSFAFGAFLPHNVFVIALQTQFKQTEGLDDLLEMVASIRESDVQESIDNRVAQEVKVQSGIKLTVETVKNPHTLEPFRTFREVEQPASDFVLRLQSGPVGTRPQLALFEADGGAWKIEAMKRVGEWLDKRLKEKVPVIF